MPEVPNCYSCVQYWSQHVRFHCCLIFLHYILFVESNAWGKEKYLCKKENQNKMSHAFFTSNSIVEFFYIAYRSVSNELMVKMSSWDVRSIFTTCLREFMKTFLYFWLLILLTVDFMLVKSSCGDLFSLLHEVHFKFCSWLSDTRTELFFSEPPTWCSSS